MMPEIIICGGAPLQGCPKDWDEARIWEEKANDGKYDAQPLWRFDCGFKLDFDGPLVEVSSRFYPPKTFYGPKWDGNVTIMVMGEELFLKHFEEDSIDSLKASVEDFAASLKDRIVDALKSINNVKEPQP